MTDERRHDATETGLGSWIDRNYRPAPLAPAERAAILHGYRSRLEGRSGRSRAPGRLVFAASAAAAALLLTFLVGLPLQEPLVGEAEIDSVLIPAEAYSDATLADLDDAFDDTLPADYLAIEALLLAP